MKRILALLLTTAMAVTLLAVPVSAESDNMVTGWIYGDKFFYSDAYFSKDASIYNPSLSTMSFLMTSAGNADDSDNWSHQYRRLFQAFQDLGFTDAEVNEDFETEPTMDSMGIGVAHKIILVNGQTYTLLAVVPRMNYMAEWANNFTIDAFGEASGFSDSAKIAETFLSNYIAKYSSSFDGELKLWLVGYSRGAAVANLVAGHISKAGEIGGLPVRPENIYAYTFETPMGANTSVVSLAEARSYTNIHNIISPNDLITKLAPEEWGFLRYGTDESIIPDVRTAENDALFETALSFLPEYLAAYDTDGQRVFATELFQAKRYSLSAEDHRVNTDKSMGDFLNDLTKALATGIGTRGSYTALVQDTLRLLMSEVCGNSYQTAAWQKAKTVLTEKLQECAPEILTLACAGRETELKNLLTGIFDEAIAESGLDKKAYEALPVQLSSLIPILVGTIMADVAIDDGSDILTFIDNLNILLYPHYGAQVTSWLMALDKNYNPEAADDVAPVAVTDVKVNISKTTTTKKVLFSNISVVCYKTEIVPVVNGSVRKVEYRKYPVGRMTEGTSFTQDLKPTYLYIDVTDANGNVTHWEFRNGTVKQVN